MATQHAVAATALNTHTHHPDLADLSTLLSQLIGKSPLHRTRAHNFLSSQITNWNPDAIGRLEESLIPLLEGNPPWETVFGAVAAGETCLPHSSNLQFHQKLISAAGRLITHPEPRVRQAVANLIGTLATNCGVAVWQALTPQLISHVESNFSLDDSARLEEASAVTARELDATAASAKSASAMLHETEGWRSLETMLLALGRLVDGCGEGILSHITDGKATEVVPELGELLAFTRRASAHPNRFVREAGLKLLNSIAAAAARVRVGTSTSRVLLDVAKSSVSVIRDGLEDNWSQVRFASSVAVRTVLQGLSEQERKGMYIDLLPRMCLNRHYVAEGVRNYSQETWRQVVGSAGRGFLEENLAVVVEFYETMCKADNHAVREAACQSLSEVALKLDGNVVNGMIGRIMNGLIGGFKDESWPVRDHACRSLAEVVSVFGTEVEKTGRLGEIFELFSAHLCDNIPSVRSNCAEAFVKCGLAYGNEDEVIGLRRISEVGRELLRGIERQKEREKAEGGHGDASKDTQYGASSVLAGDREHTDQVMYSCGSLAPRLRRGGGCSDHGFVRPKEGWEEADGGVLLWKNLMGVSRGREIGHAMVGDIARAGICGGKKTFSGRSRFLGGLLKAVGRANVKWAELEERVLCDIVQVAGYGKEAGGAAKAEAAKCSQVVRNGLGLRRFQQVVSLAQDSPPQDT